MTIRLTSVQAFDKVLEKLRQDPFYIEKLNAAFFRFSYSVIKNGLNTGSDEWFLDIERHPYMVLRYHKRSEILTDQEYLTQNQNTNN
ncbi:MAG: hypothetical protein HDS72_04495 [Bacteroidales bacterium]|nr:hypothetical protein [Bacteroidales bacterium]